MNLSEPRAFCFGRLLIIDSVSLKNLAYSLGTLQSQVLEEQVQKQTDLLEAITIATVGDGDGWSQGRYAANV